MTNRAMINSTQIGLLEETLNIGAGNSITALSQILDCDADMSFPQVKGFINPIGLDSLAAIGEKNITVEMGVVGELQGGLVVVISEPDAVRFSDLIRHAKEEQQAEGVPNLSILSETSNIMAGTFLTAIHDFCGLNVFHTVPVTGKNDKLHLLNLMSKYADSSSDFILVTNEFSVNALNIKAYLLLILSPVSIIRLIKSIENIHNA